MTSSFACRKLTVLAVFHCAAIFAAECKAGIATQTITPTEPIYLTGYANRTHPSEGVVHDIKAKALAIEDRSGGKVVIVTTDLIGLPRSITDAIAARVQKDHGIDRSRLIINSSHTHTGPLIAHNLELMFDLKPDEQRVVDEYSRKLTADLVAVI